MSFDVMWVSLNASWFNHVIMVSPSQLRARWVSTSWEFRSTNHGIIMWLCFVHLSFGLDGFSMSWGFDPSIMAEPDDYVFTIWALGLTGFDAMGVPLHTSWHNQVILFSPSELRARCAVMSWEFRSMHHGIVMWLWFHHLSFGLDRFWCHGSLAPCIIA